MIKIYEKIINKEIIAKMLLQVHDELIFEIDDTVPKKSIDEIKSTMENVHAIYKDFRVPIVVEYGIGNNWGESH